MFRVTILWLMLSMFLSCKDTTKNTLLLPVKEVPKIDLSLAQWSFHRAMRNGEMDNFQFIEKAAQLGFTGVEYVNQFFKDKSQDTVFLSKLNEVAKKHNIRQVLIMIDEEGNLADTSLTKREESIAKHQKWVDAAAYLGCHAIRVNLYGNGNKEEVASAGIDGLNKLADYAADRNINILVENHGGYSSNADWLVGVIEKVNKPNVGTLPDFSNFCIEYQGGAMWGNQCLEEFDKYTGVQLMMPYAKGVSAKSFDFGEMGYETTIDYTRMLEIIFKSGYSGYIGIEYEGKNLNEENGVIATKELLEKCIHEQIIRF